MTILDGSYGSFQYEPIGQLGRILALAKMEFSRIFKSKRGLTLFIACVVYVVVLLVFAYFNLGPEAAEAARARDMLPPRMSPFRREFYLGFSTNEGFLAFILLTAIISVRSISGDKAVNALEIYWTRGITPWGYFLGKWMGSFALLATVFVAGPLVVWVYGMVSAPDMFFIETTARFVPMILVALVLKCVVLSFLAVGFSALGSSPNVATFLWLIVILGSSAMVELLQDLSRRRDPEDISGPDWYGALCPWDAVVRVEEHIGGMVRASDYPVWIAWTSLAAFCVVLIVFVRPRLRTTEAIG